MWNDFALRPERLFRFASKISIKLSVKTNNYLAQNKRPAKFGNLQAMYRIQSSAAQRLSS